MTHTAPPTKPDSTLFHGRFTRFLKQVIEPARFTRITPLRVSAWQTAPRVPHAVAIEQDYTPVQLGFRWGPKWSTCWFKLEATIPEHAAGQPVDLRFSTRTEATLYRGSTPVRGLDLNRETARWTDAARAGETITAYIEAACNHPFGVVTFDWDTQDTADRWQTEDPGLLTIADLVTPSPAVISLHDTYRFATDLLAELPEDHPLTQPRYDALRAATVLIDDRDVAANAVGAEQLLKDALADEPKPGVPHPTGYAVGHAHIDTAWLWPIAETRRKVIRSWSNALDLIDRDDRFIFIASQAQQYAYIEADAPELFARIKSAAEAGRWEPIGAMWIEPDVNIPSGESLIRQVVHADRYWRTHFGDELGTQRICYLPDTFGFPASLPDILLAAGVDTFVTNKISWNQLTPYPHTSFRWQGLGGRAIAAHFTPNHDYNCTNSPKELRKTLTNVRGFPDGVAPTFLHPFGFGDGGGGPTRAMIHNADLASGCTALPNLKHAGMNAFRANLLEQADALPTHAGELYLELHRATITTHPWLKRANREAEELLRDVEWRLVAEGPDAAAKHAPSLDEAWKLLLLQQFHDILPGSSITEVYDDARRDLARIEQLASDARQAITPPADASRAPTAPAIFNPASHERSGVIETPDGPVLTQPVAAMTQAALEPAKPSQPVVINEQSLELANASLTVRIDRETGHLSVRTNEDSAKPFADLNRLRLYRDIPMNWDAWDLDAYYEEELLWSTANAEPPEIRLRTSSDVRAEIEITRTIPEAGHITQTVRLDTGAPMVEIHTAIGWCAAHRVLRAEFPTDIQSVSCTCGIQFGHCTRPTTRNTPTERMMFEWCAHRWIDLSGPDRGIALFTRDRYGHSAHAGRLGLTLMRAPTHPDPTAGTEASAFAYALLPHSGCWKDADVDREAEAFNRPITPVERTAVDETRPVSITTTGHANIEIAAIKPGHDDPSAIVVRIVETRGEPGQATISFNTPVTSIVRTNALEREHEPIAMTGNGCTLEVNPFEIITLLATRA